MPPVTFSVFMTGLGLAWSTCSRFLNLAQDYLSEKFAIRPNLFSSIYQRIDSAHFSSSLLSYLYTFLVHQFTQYAKPVQFVECSDSDSAFIIRVPTSDRSDEHNRSFVLLVSDSRKVYACFYVSHDASNLHKFELGVR